jgi:hypothetical protein
MNFTYGAIFGILVSVIPIVWVIAVLVRRNKIRKQKDKIASLIVSSNLRSIPEIAQHAKLSENRTIKMIRALIADTGEHALGLELGNDSRYLRGAKLNLRTMEVVLSEKYVAKEDRQWTCGYCKSINPMSVFKCQSCHAPRKTE